MKYAIIDIGSNTVKMCIYRAGKKTFRKNDTFTRPVKLIGYLKNGILSEEGVSVLCQTLNEYRARAEGRNCDVLRAFATASLRRASNAEDVIDRVKAHTGIRIEILSGQSEAQMSLTGVRREIGMDRSGILLDLGGGSTEAIAFGPNGQDALMSMPFGSLSLYQDHVAGILPDAFEQQAIRASIASAYSSFAARKVQSLFVAGGTGRAVCRVRAYLIGETSNGLCRFTAQEIFALEERLSGPEGERIIRESAPERQTTLLPGLIAISVIAHTAKATEVLFPISGVREGYLLSIL